MRSCMKKVRETFDSSNPSHGADPTDSFPIVFDSFGSADLVGSGIAEADSLVDARNATESLVPGPPGDDDEPLFSAEDDESVPAFAASAEAQQTTGQSSISSILRPFSHFFGSGRDQTANADVAGPSMRPAEAVDSPLDDPLIIHPQTSSTPK